MGLDETVAGLVLLDEVRQLVEDELAAGEIPCGRGHQRGLVIQVDADQGRQVAHGDAGPGVYKPGHVGEFRPRLVGCPYQVWDRRPPRLSRWLVIRAWHQHTRSWCLRQVVQRDEPDALARQVSEKITGILGHVADPRPGEERLRPGVAECSRVGAVAPR